ncbi:hypothetical protein C1H46_044794 [Malus baccata]|uniref:Uncharacterized protein n=1 Tax=Malus baccata TaxID=106549 RepID=A0A540K625_MALBA|nr:hypothetical protein C1H46_044794 [Malus baccata]
MEFSLDKEKKGCLNCSSLPIPIQIGKFTQTLQKKTDRRTTRTKNKLEGLKYNS